MYRVTETRFGGTARELEGPTTGLRFATLSRQSITRIELAGGSVQTVQCRYGALLEAYRVIPAGLDQLEFKAVIKTGNYVKHAVAPS